MGVFIDYSFHIECSEAELVERLRRLRRKLCQLPFKSVSRVLRVNPAYLPVPLKLLPKHGFPLPPAVRARLRGKLGTKHDELCLYAASGHFMLVPVELQKKFFEPAVRFSKTTTLWKHDDLPEKIEASMSLTFFRMAFAVELASVML